MSVVVAIKEKDRVIFGADSQVTRGGTRKTLSNPNNYKIWRIDGVPGCMMAMVGPSRNGNIIKAADGLIPELAVLKDEVDFKFVVNHLVPTIFELLEESKAIDKSAKRHMESTILFAYRDRLYYIGSYGAVIEVDDYCAIGSGESEALGSLISTEQITSEERIKLAIKASAANDIYVDYPIVIGDTAGDSFKVFYEKDL